MNTIFPALFEIGDVPFAGVPRLLLMCHRAIRVVSLEFAFVAIRIDTAVFDLIGHAGVTRSSPTIPTIK
jgi:hypothetical protein